MYGTVGQTLAAHAIKSPNRLAYWDAQHQQGRRYAELDQRANRLANAFIAAGLAPGDRVAVWMKTSLATVDVYYAAARAGLIVTPVNDQFVPSEAIDQIESSDASALVYSAALAGHAAGVIGSVDLRLVASDEPTAPDGIATLDELVARGRTTPPPSPEPEDTFLLGFTSGTTGRPKGAIITHQSVLAAGRLNALSYRLPIGSIGLYRGSMSFVATIGSFLMSHLHVGGTVVLASSGDPEWIVDALIEHGANYTSIATPLLDGFREAVIKRPEALDTLSSVLHGASAAPPDMLREFVEVFGARFLEGWGMTEHSGALVTATTARDVTGRSEATGDVLASVGRAVPDTVVSLVDSERRALVHDGESVGELVIASPALARGYWKNPAATADSFADGWYYTGDLATIDEAGYVYISDRRSDLIVSGGINIYPREVESVLARMPGVREVAVVGAPHEKWGQSVVAVMVREPGSFVTEESVITYARASMASFKKPTRVVFVDELPKTPSEKIRRHDVRRLVQGHPEGAQAP